MKLYALLCLLSVCLVQLMGCSESESARSSDIETSGMYAGITVTTSNIDSSDIEVFLLVGGSDSNTYVDLVDGDTLTATLNSSASQDLVKFSQQGHPIFYRTTFNETGVAGAENSDYTIAFTRPSKTSAPNSTVTLPARVIGVSATDPFSRQTDDLSISWAGVNSTEDLRLAISGNCIYTYKDTVKDTGSYTIIANTLASNSFPSETCDITIALTRSQNGSLDPAYGSGYVVTNMSGVATVASNP